MKKRFIAGATCPDCQKMDTLVTFESEGVRVFECVECGHRESMSDTKDVEKSQKSETKRRENVIQWIDIDNQ